MTDEELPADRIARLEAALDASADENVRLAGEVADLEATLSQVMQFIILLGRPESV